MLAADGNGLSQTLGSGSMPGGSHNHRRPETGGRFLYAAVIRGNHDFLCPALHGCLENVLQQRFVTDAEEKFARQPGRGVAGRDENLEGNRHCLFL